MGLGEDSGKLQCEDGQHATPRGLSGLRRAVALNAVEEFDWRLRVCVLGRRRAKTVGQVQWSKSRVAGKALPLTGHGAFLEHAV